MAATAIRTCKQQPAAKLFHACSLPSPIPASSLHLSCLISCFFPSSSPLQPPHIHIQQRLLLEHPPPSHRCLSAATITAPISSLLLQLRDENLQSTKKIMSPSASAACNTGGSLVISELLGSKASTLSLKE